MRTGIRTGMWAAVAALTLGAAAVSAKTTTVTGTVGDAMCGTKHMMAGDEAGCTRACVQKGSDYALIVKSHEAHFVPRALANVYEYLDYLTNRAVPDFSLEIRGALEGLWSSSSVAGSQKSVEELTLSCQACGLPDEVTVGASPNT